MEMQKTQEKNRYDNRAAIDIVIWCGKWLLLVYTTFLSIWSIALLNMINKDLPRINRLMIIGTLYLFIMFCRASDISAITYILLRSSQRNQTFLYSLWIPARVKINSHTKKLWKSALQIRFFRLFTSRTCIYFEYQSAKVVRKYANLVTWQYQILYRLKGGLIWQTTLV
jgi:hypothetical protein